jgi:hypothetical protein
VRGSGGRTGGIEAWRGVSCRAVCWRAAQHLHC